MPQPDLQTNLKKSLEATLGLLDSVPTRAEFVDAFKDLVAFVKDVRATLAKDFTTLRNDVGRRIDALTENTKADHAADLAATKQEARGVFARLQDEQRKAINYLHDRVSRLRDGEKGEKGDPGKDGSPDTGDDIIGKINDAQRLIDKEAVQGLTKLEDRVKTIELRPAAGPVGRFFGAKGFMLYVDGQKKLLTANTLNLVAGAGVTLSYNHANGRNDITISASSSGSLSVLAATGTVDDSNVTFTFASAPTLVVVNGSAYRHGKGVSISGTTATLDAPVGAGGDIYGLG